MSPSSPRPRSAPAARPVTRRGFLGHCLGGLSTWGLSACGRSPSASPALLPEARLAARPGDPGLEAPSGMSPLGLGGGRDGLLYVPGSCRPDRPAPLLVALHGAGGAGSYWAGYFPRAESRGMVLLAPDSRSATWDLVRGPVGPDVTFLDQALAHTFARCAIDPSRLALAGFSDGASYALSLGVANGDLFTHLLAFSPGFVEAPSPLVGSPAVFVSHGRDDPVLPLAHTRNQIVPTLRASGYQVTFRPFDGGHQLPAEISEAALDWFLGDS